MSELIFISNELLSPELRNALKIPLMFVGYAFTKGKMYKHRNSCIITNSTSVKKWGNSVVYGAVYLLQDYSHFIRILDAYHSCSKAMLRKNNAYDFLHREEINVTMIKFNSIDELKHLKYVENDTVQVEAYVCNLENNNAKRIVFNNMNSQRIQSGVNANIIKQIKHEMEELI